MIKLQGLSGEELREIARQTADAFYDYTYNGEDIGLIKYISSREAMFIYNACFCDGGTIETRMRKEKRKFLRIEMLIVRKEYQGQGLMRQMMEYAYKTAESHRVPVILDTDDKDKAARYEHLGMKLDRVRNCGERFHMYDLIREIPQ